MTEFKRFTNPRQQGDIGVMAAMYYYAQRGYQLLLPTTESTRYDLVLDDGECNFTRVQCKTGTYSRNEGRSFKVNLTTAGGNQSWSGVAKKISKDECDIVFIWCANGSMWEVPANVLDGKSSFTAGWCNRQYLIAGPEPEPQRYRARTQSLPVEPSTCAICGIEISPRAKWCKTHAGMESQATRIAWLPDDELLELVQNTSYSEASRHLGVSDNAIRKRLRRRGLI